MYISWINAATLRCATRFDCICMCVHVHTLLYGGYVICCTVYSLLGDWQVKQAWLSVIPVALENWPIGHSVSCCPEGKGKFYFPLPPISLSLWLCSSFCKYVKHFPCKQDFVSEIWYLEHAIVILWQSTASLKLQNGIYIFYSVPIIHLKYI